MSYIFVMTSVIAINSYVGTYRLVFFFAFVLFLWSEIMCWFAGTNLSHKSNILENARLPSLYAEKGITLYSSCNMFVWITSAHSFITLVNSSQYFLNLIFSSDNCLLIQAFQLSIDNKALRVGEQKALQHEVFEYDEGANYVDDNKCRNKPVVLFQVI